MVSIFSTSTSRISRRSGNSSSRRFKTFPDIAALITIAALAVLPAPAAETPIPEARAPYVVLTTDGHRIDVMEKPVVQGEKIQIRLSPGGQLAVYPAKLIDWPATEKINAPPPPPATEPAATPEPGMTPFASAISGATVTTTGGILELKLIGGGHAQTTTIADGSGATVSGGEGAASGAKPADPNATAGTLAGLTREFADLKPIHDGAAASKTSLEAQIADLQAKSVNAAPAGLNYSETPTEKELNQARAALQSANELLAQIEKRMSAIRARAIDLGGSVD